MLTAFIILPVSFLIWFGLVRIFSINKESLINVLSKKVLNDLNLVFRNILDILDSLFKSFIQIYELLGLILKNIVVISKSISSTFIQSINLFKVIVITLMSFISLCKSMYEETKNINLVNSFEVILNQTKSAKNNVVSILNVKRDKLNNKEVTLER
tara:strand:- start:153 stop:620 length:468 start_codon:yes stop_codon:yes gene_type:complete